MGLQVYIGGRKHGKSITYNRFARGLHRKISVVIRIQKAIDNKELVVYVKNTKKLRSGRKTNELVKNLNICSEYIICKETASAFSNTKLQELLRENQIAEIEIAGIDGNSCVKSTAIDAVHNGYKTILQYDCIGVQNIKRFEITKELLLEKEIIIK